MKYSSTGSRKLSVNNSEFHFIESDEDRSRKSRSNAIVVKPVTKKENSSGPHSSDHKNSFEKLQTKKKRSNSVNDKSPLETNSAGNESNKFSPKSRKEIWMDK
jgi:hypothetical protein